MPSFFYDIQDAKFVQSVSIIRVDVASGSPCGEILQGFQCISLRFESQKTQFLL